MARHVVHHGGLDWDFSKLHTMPIDPEFTRLVESFLASVLASDSPNKGWKLPETTLVLPWIVRMFPDISYVYWTRDPRDSILGAHLTDDLATFGVPYDVTDDLYERRAISWQYQYQIMHATPRPAKSIDVQFEDFVLCQEDTLGRLEAFFGLPLARIAVHPETVGRWRSAEQPLNYAFFPPETLYGGSTP
jgi:hypothetical protein